MIDRSVDLLLRRSEMRVRLSCNFRDNMTRCLERSLRAIERSRQLLANSESLLNCPEPCEPENRVLGSLPVVSKRDFGYEFVPADGKHFCDCTFTKCTLLYSGLLVTFESCRFQDCKFEFSGAAGRTVQFLDCFGLLSERTDEPSAMEFVN